MFDVRLLTLVKSIGLLGVVLALLTPLGAGAHGGLDFGPGDAVPFSGSLVAGHTAHAAGRIAAGSWSRPCPGGPGNACCCGVSSACVGSGKAAVVSTGGWNILVLLFAGRVTRPQARVERASWLPHSFALSRAPPLFS